MRRSKCQIIYDVVGRLTLDFQRDRERERESERASEKERERERELELERENFILQGL